MAAGGVVAGGATGFCAGADWAVCGAAGGRAAGAVAVSERERRAPPSSPPPPVRDGAALVAGAGTKTGGAAGTVTVVTRRVLVAVLLTRGAVELVRGRLTAGGCALVGGARCATTDSGSEARPIRWLASWLAAHVMPAVNAMPRTAMTAQSAVLALKVPP